MFKHPPRDSDPKVRFTATRCSNSFIPKILPASLAFPRFYPDSSRYPTFNSNEPKILACSSKKISTDVPAHSMRHETCRALLGPDGRMRPSPHDQRQHQ